MKDIKPFEEQGRRKLAYLEAEIETEPVPYRPATQYRPQEGGYDAIVDASCTVFETEINGRLVMAQRTNSTWPKWMYTYR